MIDKTEINELAKLQNLRPEVVEKDYMLGWILAGIANHNELGPKWIFKGGTCLKKCYFETYRFSEDLDFTLKDETHLNVDFLKNAFSEIADWVHDQSGNTIPKDRLHFDLHPDPEKKYVEGRVYYQGPSGRAGSLPRILLDLTSRELLALPPSSRSIHHPYTDRPTAGFTANCYSYEEVFAEKIRALAERCRPRDLYDVVHLYRNEQLLDDKVVVFETLKRKCEFKTIPIPTLDSIQNHERKDELHSQWENMLRHQLAALPPIDSFLSELPNFFDWLFEEEDPEIVASQEETEDLAIPAPKVTRPTSDIPAPISARFMGIQPGASTLERIRFGAANRLCLKLRYSGKVRTIEPYAVKRTIAGSLYLAAFEREERRTKNFTIDKIEGIELTETPFTPQWPIEVTAHGTLNIAQNVSSAPSRSRSSRSYGSGIKYVYRCPTCGKLFYKSQMDSSLRTHKNKRGSQCYGSYGHYVRTKYH